MEVAKEWGLLSEERPHADATDATDAEALSKRARELDDALSALYMRVPDPRGFARLEDWWAAHQLFEAEAGPLGEELADVEMRLGDVQGGAPALCGAGGQQPPKC